jgi:hypothetical protein
MKQFASILMLAFGLPFLVNAQSFSTQILNKGAITANNAKLQDYDEDGDLDVILSRKDPDVLIWFENEPTKQFPMHNLVTQNIDRIRDLDLADFDQDGDIDYLVCIRATTAETDGELAWFQRQSDGTYIKWTIDTGADFSMADIADFNGDGLMDIVSVGFWNTGLSVYFNQGNFFFTEQNIPFPYPQADIVSANDFDNDNDVDFVVGSTNECRIYRNGGSGAFTLSDDLNSGSNFISVGHFDMEIADLNNDGLDDIVTFDDYGGFELCWIPNSGSGFGTRIKFGNFTIYDSGGDIVVADFDQNGLKDVIWQNTGGDYIAMYKQTSLGQFEFEKIEQFWDSDTDGTGQMTTGDLDGDGDTDLIIPEYGNIDYDISWFENIGGEFFRHYFRNQSIAARIPKFADIDNDGDKDILVTLANDNGFLENEVMLYENLGNNNFTNWRLNDSIGYAADIEPSDIDNDGDIDAFVTARDATDLIWLKNDGKKGNWDFFVIDQNVNQALGIRAKDIDVDGDDDVVLCSNNDDKVFWYQNSGAGAFTKFVVDANVDAPREIEAADIDGDGDIDFALACGSTINTVVVYINNGAQSFTKQVVFTGKTAFDIEIADWNNDGKPDIVFTLSATSPVNPQQEVVALINNGGNSFTTTPLVINAEKGTGLKVADLDNDGDMDFVVGRNQQVRARMWLQTPTGLVGSTISDAGASGSTPQVLGLDVADTNGDGRKEIVFADISRDELVLVSINCFAGATISASKVNATCGQPNGSATVTATGGTDISYKWSNNATTATIANLATGTYTVTVTANGGCTSTATVSITAQPIATLSTSKTNAFCGIANGTATVNAQNGVGLAGFLWSSGATTQTATELAAGVYTVTVTDINGCTVTSSATITAVAVATLTTTPSNTTCGNNDGKVTVTVSGGASISSYLWSNGATTKNLTNLSGGTYTVTATDANGCQIIGQATVVGLVKPVVSLGADITLPQGQSAVLDATGTDLTYLWSTGATSATITVNSMGTYTVTVTNSFGCTAIDAIVVTLTSSTTDLDNKYKVTVTPNPTESIINIKCEGGVTTSVQVFDNLGQLMIEDNSIVIDGALRTLNIANYPSGVYYVKVSGKGFAKTIKIVKN